MEKQTVFYLLGITGVATLMAIAVWQARQTYRTGKIALVLRSIIIRVDRVTQPTAFWSLFFMQMLIVTGGLVLGSWIIYIKILQIAGVMPTDAP